MKIQQAQEALERAREQLRSAVREARLEGRTWAEIGGELGMSRQAAFKRFGEVTNPADGSLKTGALMSIDKIRTLTEQVFDHIAQGEYPQLEALMHPDVRTELPASLISETWARVLGEVGAKESFGDTHVELPGGERIGEDEKVLGTVVGVTTVHCEAGDLMGRVAVDDQLRVVGLLIVPPGQTSLPF